MGWSPASLQIQALGLDLPMPAAPQCELGDGTIMLQPWWDWDKRRVKKGCRTGCC